MLLNKYLSLVVISALSTTAFAKGALETREGKIDTKESIKAEKEVTRIETESREATKKLSANGWGALAKENASIASLNGPRLEQAMIFLSKRNPKTPADVATAKAVLHHMAVTKGDYSADKYEQAYAKVAGNQKLVEAVDALHNYEAYFMQVNHEPEEDAQLLAIHKLESLSAAKAQAAKDGDAKAITALNNVKLSDLSTERVAKLKKLNEEIKENGCAL